MNVVEIEAAISELALQPFDAAEFPFELRNTPTLYGVESALMAPGVIFRRRLHHFAGPDGDYAQGS